MEGKDYSTPLFSQEVGQNSLGTRDLKKREIFNRSLMLPVLLFQMYALHYLTFYNICLFCTQIKRFLNLFV